jgi:ribosomal protein S18 acetylase RimI-like enzyme
MVIRPLSTSESASDFDALFAAFTEAFSDYVVPLTPTREQLLEMFTRRGWLPEASVGAFENDRMVAFTINGVEDTRAYDTGTGVVPTHRRHGLARDLMRASYPLLRARGCTEYVLEVLEANARAHGLYLAEGFVEMRGLQSWRFESPGLLVSESHRDVDPVSSMRPGDYETRRLLWDVLPSWQNTPTSISRATDAHVTLGNDDGYVIVFPSNGDVPELAVRREARRRGAGTALLRAAAEVAGKPLRIMNVDERDVGIAAFLERAGAVRFVRQLEMVRAL